MSVSLDSSISWKNAAADDAAMLEALQPNIVKAHVRDFMKIFFLSFDTAAAGRTFLRKIRRQMKNAKKHLDEVETFKTSGKPGTPYVGVGLTAAGYRAIGIATAQTPSDAAFLAGMQSSRDNLNDPAPATWESHLQDANKLHAVVIAADEHFVPAADAHERVSALINSTPGVQILGTEDGLSQWADGEGIEHFGYVDGRSQPLFLKEDIQKELDGAPPPPHSWNPEFPLRAVIVSDPASPDPRVHFGSYFVFRKLEQNVKKFKEAETAFGERMKLAADDEERAGAMLVGRFENGSPATMSGKDDKIPPPNNFTYADDLKGSRCPFVGHIRKTNPRGTGNKEPEAKEREHLMARRGQTYGIRADDPRDKMTSKKPERWVGLLFMAFNSNIGNQFEFTQSVWANNPDFPNDSVGIDPIIGQTTFDRDGKPGPDTERIKITCPRIWDKEDSFATVDTIGRYVTMKGGEYFFMPSLPFLESL